MTDSWAKGATTAACATTACGGAAPRWADKVIRPRKVGY
jgi:hypothetical protein